ncbi:cytochrome P450 [Novosphingobium lentum]|uniref:cytochrome P450 n=1 Tax=Novosphingobium lentum TaxID=145287 RepID=UPI0008309A24|nr:cytochrome P450 [Novosphingobium lentum]
MATQLMPDVAFHEPSLLADPFAFYAAQRGNAPVASAEGPGGQRFFLVISYAMVEEVSKRAADFSSQMGHLLMAGGDASPEVAAILAQDWIDPARLLISDDPDHKRYRAIVNSVFAQGRIANMAPTVQRIADELIDDFIEAGTCDFVNRFAVLLPTYIIADILGLPRDQYAKVRQWSDGVIRIVSRMGTPAEELEGAKMVLEMRRFIKATIAARRVKPEDDLISLLIAARVEGMDPLTDDEIAPSAFEIAVAGNETTRNTLMSGLARLIRDPAQMQALGADPSLMPGAVEELLRYETPATSMWRIATRDTQLGGVDIPQGAALLLRYDAANRDPAKFENPERFDIRRKNAHQQVAFGGFGVHRCLGQMLARKELAIGFNTLLARLHNLRIVEGSDTDYWPGLLHRGITSLTIAFDPGARVFPKA